jgi:hypothetical protein
MAILLFIQGLSDTVIELGKLKMWFNEEIRNSTIFIHLCRVGDMFSNSITELRLSLLVTAALASGSIVRIFGEKQVWRSAF